MVAKLVYMASQKYVEYPINGEKIFGAATDEKS